MEKIEGLMIQPWVPESYKNGSSPYGRLLLLGESHYSDKTDPDFISNITSYVVEQFLNENMTHRYLTSTGKIFHEDKYDVWKNAAFANLIQHVLPFEAAQPTQSDRDTIAFSFPKLLESLKPKKIIVMSSRLWADWLPEIENSSIVREPLIAEGTSRRSNVWKYTVQGHDTYAMGINHPSWINNYAEWRPLVKTFLAEKF